MSYTPLIGIQDDWIERQSICPTVCRCPHCGQKGRRVNVLTRQIAHLGPLSRRCWIVAEVGVYKAHCGCCHYFQAPIPGVPPKGPLLV